MCLLGVMPGSAHTKVVSVEYIYQVPENVSPDQAKEVAINRARVKAIEDEFGTTVSQITSITIENTNGVSSSDFMSLGGSELRGEWIEDIDPPGFEYLTDGSQIALKVRLKGRIRECKRSKVQIDAKILCNGYSDSAISDKFTSGDALYISFLSPVDGYLAIYYLDNEGNAFCLLPYQSQGDGIFQIKANRKYYLFDPKHPGSLSPKDIDEFIVETESESEKNRIMMIFSPNKFIKGADIKQSSDLPRLMNRPDFQKWVSNLVKKDTELTIVERPLTIYKKE